MIKSTLNSNTSSLGPSGQMTKRSKLTEGSLMSELNSMTNRNENDFDARTSTTSLTGPMVNLTVKTPG